MKKLILSSILLFFLTFTFGHSKDNKVYLKDFLPKNHVIDASQNYTTIIQEVLDANSTVVFPSNPLLISSTGLRINSNQHIQFEKGGILILEANNLSEYAVLSIENVSNVRIENVSIQGDRQRHTGKSGEWGMGIRILGSENVQVIGGEVKDCWGDGIYIARKDQKLSKNIKIQGLTISSCRRNGISIISGQDIFINDVSVKEINGTLPMAAIDIEPNNSEDQLLGSIHIKNFSSKRCGIGIQVGLSRYPNEDTKVLDIVFENISSSNDANALLIGDLFRRNKYGAKVKKLKGRVLFKHVKITDVQQEAIKIYSPYGYEYAPRFIFEDITLDPAQFGSNQIPLLQRQLIARGFEVSKF